VGCIGAIAQTAGNDGANYTSAESAAVITDADVILALLSIRERVEARYGVEAKKSSQIEEQEVKAA
jgi:hypothetical protein